MGTAGTYLAALDHDPVVRRDAFALLARMTRHHRSASTDLAPGLRALPGRGYSDPQQWRREMQVIHGAVPVPLALSCELPTPGSYKAIDLVGTPVLLARDEHGQVHAMVNACSHRGAELLPAGSGVVRRLVCPYHSWCYDLTGQLVAVEDEALFGTVDRARLRLPSVSVAERAGLVFVRLSGGGPIDLDRWLGPELGYLLDALDLGSCTHHAVRVLDGPNWKIVLDGYLEGYHVATAHRDSVADTVLSDMATFDAYGPHMRNVFALRAIAGLGEEPDVASLVASLSPVYWLFPGLNISGGWTERVAVSLVLPGASCGVSYTEQHTLLRRPPHDQAAREAADRSADRLWEIVRDEDYVVAHGVQRGSGAVDGRQFLAGRNEPAVQHFHETIEGMIRGDCPTVP